VDWLIRFFVGGAVVSTFAILGDVVRPKSFAGIFGAPPPVVLATLALTLHTEGASTECRIRAVFRLQACISRSGLRRL
jgi:Protein of unknown function (DUF3147)